MNRASPAGTKMGLNKTKTGFAQDQAYDCPGWLEDSWVSSGWSDMMRTKWGLRAQEMKNILASKRFN
ncbi:uncharacterized protein G2W53_044698 [Senna tora]|uniref:Uncharacterized protein n=1 Tax=Senna tora TaxID=362788 RepID=A0A834SBT9_9FABA|nr:uncharacterized protein G2W53_044698 [Senna tora]